MSKRLLIVVGIVAVVVGKPFTVPGFAVASERASEQRSEKPVALITSQANDGTLPGWDFYCEEKGTACGDVWTFADGILTCKGTPKGYISTRKKHTDFVLKLQWRWPVSKKPGNGGVLIRTTGPDKIWPKSLEAQINAGQAGDFWGLAGYSLKGPADRMSTLSHEQLGKLTNVKQKGTVEKPAGEWNDYEISAKQGIVTLKINGLVVNEARRCEVVPGKICLTAEGNEIQFRAVQLLVK